MPITYRDAYEIDLDQLTTLFNFYLHLDLGFEPFENVLARRRKF